MTDSSSIPTGITSQTGRRVGWVLIGACTGMVVVVLLTVLISIRGTQQNNSPILKSTEQAATSADRTLEQIEDCTTPGRECYERGVRRTADAIASINEVAIYAAACADKPRRQSVEEIQSCVIARLAAEDD